jgi:AMP-polyphosphate phosphotransferase
MALFDHSWYGRVLVERVDKITPKKEWKQAYQQIAELERWLTDDGQVLIKYFLHISKAEQKKRFRACLNDPLLKWKITKEYKRHHREYGRWMKAIEEMLAKTDTANAPWTIVEANDLRWARVRVFETLIGKLRAELARRKEMADARAAAKAAAAAAASGPQAEEKKTANASEANKTEAAHA